MVAGNDRVKGERLRRGGGSERGAGSDLGAARRGESAGKRPPHLPNRSLRINTDPAYDYIPRDENGNFVQYRFIPFDESYF